MIYQFIDDQRRPNSVRQLCRTLGVSPSGYYAWRQRPPSARTVANQRLVTQMRLIHHEVCETYGSPRMHAELVARGLPCNVKRVARLMRLHHWRARHKRRYRVTTKVNPKLPVAPNHLAQHFQASAPNEKWVGDITYAWTREGWLYLAVGMDLYSRRIVGWALASTQDTTLVIAALQMAIGRRQPPSGLLHHSDRGSQYTSAPYQAVLQTHRCTVSMSGTGNCFDNAAMESCFGTLKAERINRQNYQTRDQARQDIVSYVEGFYNVTRRHSTLGYRSPLEFEQQALAMT
jgi:transposase InsO family protein